MNLYLVLFCFVLLNSQVFSLPSPTPGLSPPEANDDFADHQDNISCLELSDTCAGCLAPELNCKFALFNDSETLCVDKSKPDEEIQAMKPNMTLEDIHLTEDKCPTPDDKPKTVPPKFSTKLTPENETTVTPQTPSSSSSSTTTTTATSTTTVTTTTVATTSTASTSTKSTTTKPTTVTTSTTKTSTEAPTTPTESPVTTPTTPNDPSGRGGSKFDGWSFFGGILLTIGLSAIGFVSFKYYKVRSGSHAGTNYNRF